MLPTVPIKPLFTDQQFKARTDKVLEQIRSEIYLTAFREIGDKAIEIAWQSTAYWDVTGNLRSSIGYIITKDGQIVASKFKRGKGSGNGAQKGRNFAESIAADYSSGYALILVAGAAYAAKVESRGKDVLTSATQFADRELPKLLKRLAKSATT